MGIRKFERFLECDFKQFDVAPYQTKTVLACLAIEWEDSCKPKPLPVNALAKTCRASKENICAALLWLIDKGWLVTQGKTNGLGAHYKLMIQDLPQRQALGGKPTRGRTSRRSFG